MKNITILLLFPFFTFSVFSQENSALLALKELNKQWKNCKNIAIKNVDFKSEKEKIKFHLEQVIAHLETNEPAFLNKQQKSNRTALLAELKEYAEKQIFPTNHYHTTRTPYFVDNFGVHCAVGYMMIQSGHENLVASIKEEHNFDYLEDIKTHGVSEWASNNGFTLDELKWIQPSYAPQAKYTTLLDGTNNEVKHLKNFSNNLTFSGSFDSIGNTPCRQIAYYTGTSFACYGDGLIGKINDISSETSGSFQVVGQLENNNDIYSIAQWNGIEWQFLNIPNRSGAEITSIFKKFIFTLEYYYCFN